MTMRRTPKRQPVLVLNSTDCRTVADLSRAERSAFVAASRKITDYLRTLRTFDGRLAVLGVERACQRVVATLGEQSPAHDSQGWYAAVILEEIEAVRRALALRNGEEAAAVALHVGYLLARAVHQHERQGARTGGRVTGAQIATEASRHDSEIVRLSDRWRQSENLQDDYRTAAAYVRQQTKLPMKKITRRLALIKRRLQSAPAARTARLETGQ